MNRIFEKQRTRKKVYGRWSDKGGLRTAVLLDTDGTLAGPYRNGKRDLRPTALSAIKMLSDHAPVFLWSIVEGNAERLVSEFAELGDYVTGCYAKEDFPLQMVARPYCIDDELADPQVLECAWSIVDTYKSGSDSGMLLEAAKILVRSISEKKASKRIC